MTEELKQAAQQAPKIKELVEQLRNIANGVRICGVDDRRFVAGRLDEIADALTQRPAAQEVASYFSYGEDAGYLEHATAEAAREQAKADIRGYRNDAMHDNEWPSEVDSVCWGVVLQKATAVDNSEEAGQESFDYELGPAPQQATPEPCKDDVALALAAAQQSYPNPGEPEAGWCLLERKHVEALCRAARKATPEPVGEPAVTITFGDTGMVRNLVIHDNSIKGQRLDLFTRPAPGVPDWFALVPVEPTPEMMEAMPSLPAIGAPGDMELKAKGWSLKAIQNRHRWLAALAAAQAKGGGE